LSDEVERRIPLIEERAQVRKRAIERDVVISTAVRDTERVITEALKHERVTVTRVPMDREVDEVPAVRQEGDVFVIPVVEERAVVVKRLVLVEEVHVQRSTTEEVVHIPVAERSMHVSVERESSPGGEPT
jgi:stress response protein YsnF